MDRPVDLEGIFYLSPTGHTGPVVSGYRPQHVIHANYQTSGEHIYLDSDMVKPGDSVRVAVRFITPDAHPRCVWDGRELSVQEGSRVIGTLIVARVMNESLRVTPELYSPEWIAPIQAS